MNTAHATYTAFKRIYEDSDALVPLASQRNPREANWQPGQRSELNLRVEGANHFSQSNHPTVRRQIERTIKGETTTIERIINAFRVN